MPKTVVRIPALYPLSLDSDLLGTCVGGQPIIQLKELEVNWSRYNQWKASLLEKPAQKRKRK